MKKNYEQWRVDNPRLKKLWLIMRLSSLLILLAVFSSTASVYSQAIRLTLKMENARIADVFDAIEQQSEFYFFYNRDAFDDKREVSVDFSNKNIEEILQELFKSEEVDYEIFDRNILIKIPEMETSGKKLQQQQQGSVSGIVTDETGQSLPGLTVVVKGTTRGTVTNADGRYSLSNVPENATLVFSYVGMRTQEIPVGNQTSVNVTMESDAIGIEEVVAIGYGTMRKSDLTGAVSSITAENLENQPSQNLTQALRGAVAGLDVGLDASAKGVGSLLVRGKTSLKANNAPLIVLDGVIYNGDLADINTEDVESIDILKDASSAAVFGSRAAAGVIIVTTKIGTGEPRINFNVSTGFSHLKDRTARTDVNSYLQRRSDYWEYTRTEMPEAYFRNPSNLPSGVNVDQWRGYDSGVEDFSNEEIFFSRNELNAIELENYLAGRSVDWYDEIFRTGIRQDYNVSITGASDRISYYYSLGYLDNEGFYTDERFSSIRSRLNLESDVTSFMKVGLNAQFSKRDESAEFPSYNLGVNMSPLGSVYREDGSLKFLPHDDSAVQNPFNYRNSDNFEIDYDLMANMYADILLPFGFSYRINWINQLRWDQNYSFGYTTDEQTGSGAQRNEVHFNQWFIDNILSWDKTFGVHRFNATFLYNTEKTQQWSTTAENSLFEPSEDLGYHQLNHGTLPVVGANDWISTAAAMMGRVNYTLMDKYLFTASIRRDGYSAFGVQNPWANFPSAAIAWRISDEDFFDVNGIDYLKLRVSYGVNGNRDVPTYAALQHLGAVKYIYNVDGAHQSVTGFQPTRMANPELQWERTAAWNVGADFAIVDSRITGSIEAYSMETTNLLLDRSLPSITGYSSITSNLGAVGNKGIEISVNSRNIERDNFSWNSQVIFSFNRNEIKELYGDMTDVLDEDGNVIGQEEADDFTNNWFIGEDIDRIWDYEVAGFWQLGEEEEASEFGAQPGDIKIVDQNDDGTISPREDKIFLGYETPRYKASLINNFTLFKNFDVSFLINAQMGREGSNNNHIHTGWQYGRMGRYDYPYWTPENPTNEWGKLGSNNPFGANYYVSRSFVRLQNFSVGYRIPSNFIQRFNVKALRLSFDLQNAFVASPWDLWDPETTVPTPMIGTLNLRITL